MDDIERLRAQAEAAGKLADGHGPTAEHQELLLRYLSGALHEAHRDGANATPEEPSADRDTQEGRRTGRGTDG